MRGARRCSLFAVESGTDRGASDAGEEEEGEAGKRLPPMTVKAADDAYLAVLEADLGSGDPLALQAKQSGMKMRMP